MEGAEGFEIACCTSEDSLVTVAARPFDRLGAVIQRAQDTIQVSDSEAARDQLRSLLADAIENALTSGSVGSVSSLPSHFEVGELPPIRPEAAELPAVMIPDQLRDWNVDLAERMQCPIEMVAVPTLVGFSALVGRKVTIRPRARDSEWVVIPNLWGGVIARPGRLKSPAMIEALRPIQFLEDRRLARFRETEPRRKAQLLAAEQRVAAIKEDLKKAYKLGSKLDPDALKDSLRNALSLLDQARIEAEPPRLVVNDTTVEKLHQLLSWHPNGLLQVRDELAGWLRSMEREDRRTDRQFWLETWSGDGRYTQDRIGRGTVRAEALCISVIGGIQPARFSSFVHATTRGGDGGDGLLQRRQGRVWPEDSKDWQLVDREPNREARKQAVSLFERIDEVTAEPQPRRFSSEAQVVFNEWLTDLEHRLRNQDLAGAPAFESHLSKFRSLMPSLALLFHMASACEKRRVSEQATRCAAAWCDFLEQHARKVYGSELNPDREAAHRLATRIRTGAIQDGMSIREIYRKGWSGLGLVDEVDAGLKVLADCGWTNVESVVNPDGGRPSDVLRINKGVLR